MAELVTLQALLKRSARLYGDKAAFHLLDRDVSYSDFANDVEMLGTGLIASGLRGKKIGVIGKNSYEWGLVYFAVMNIGGIIVPLDKELTAEELSDSIYRVKQKFIFYS
jgi:long-chain acyl-CoA synthetase